MGRVWANKPVPPVPASFTFSFLRANVSRFTLISEGADALEDRSFKVSYLWNPFFSNFPMTKKFTCGFDNQSVSFFSDSYSEIQHLPLTVGYNVRQKKCPSHGLPLSSP